MYAIEMRNITKKFGAFIANDNVNLKIERGSIHAIIGENGAGKSTLMNQLFGLLKPSSGQILINEKKVIISNPNDANEMGLNMVHQHFQLVENHTVLENIILGDEKSKALMPIDYKRAKYKLMNISNQYNLDIDPDLLVKKTSVGMQQRIEILKTLYRGAEILIFDEPTAMLTPMEIDGLLELFLDLKRQGKTIIFISHKLQEVKNIADKGTVIRRGKIIGTFDVKKTKIETMAEMMVGRKMISIKNDKNTKIGQTILSIENIFVKNTTNPKVMGLKDFSLNIKEGEIVAIAGVEGNGQLEIVNAIFGLSKLSKGKINILEKNKDGVSEMVSLNTASIKSRYKHGLSFVPEDRYKYAMLKSQNIYTNTILQAFRDNPFQFFGFLVRAPKVKWTKEIISEFDVRGAKGGSSIIGELSGGNQQKFIIGREMTREHKLLILFQPTRGLDIGAIEFIHKKILLEKEKGNGILLVSYDLGEIMTLADRIAVVNQGDLINVASADGLDRQTIGKWMAGVK